MSLSDPREAHLNPNGTERNDPVLWVGTEVVDGEVVAIIASDFGRLNSVPLSDVVTDVRYVDDLSKYPATGRTGPGWIDIEDMVEAAPDAVVNLGNRMTPEKMEEMKPDLAEAVSKALVEGKDYITDKEGIKYDINTLRELDT